MKYFTLILVMFLCVSLKAVTTSFSTFDTNDFIVDQPHNNISTRSGVTNDPFGSTTNIFYISIGHTNFFFLRGILTNSTFGNASTSTIATNSPDGTPLNELLTNLFFVNTGPDVVIANHAAFLNTNHIGGGGGSVPANVLTNFDTRSWTNSSAGISFFSGELVSQSFATVAGVSVGSDLSWSGTSMGDGNGINNLNASSLATGTAPAARLGSGTANNTTFLRGDNSWVGALTNAVFTNSGPATLVRGDIVFINTNNFGGGGGGGITAITGDVTASGSGSVVATLQNIPTSTTMAGSLLDTAIVSPATPASGKGQIYEDSTSKNIAIKNDAGTINHGVQTKTVTSHQWISAIADDGSSTSSQPTFTDLAAHPTTFSGYGISDTWPNLAAVLTGLIPQAALGTGSGGTGTKFLADDQTYKTISSSGITTLSPTNAQVPSVIGSTGFTPTGFISNGVFNLNSVQVGLTFGSLLQTNWEVLSGTGPSAGAGVSADFTGDGQLDFAVVRTGTILVYTNNYLNTPPPSVGQFNQSQVISPGAAPLGLATADVNGDGLPDLIIVTASTAQVWTNNGGAKAQFTQAGSSYSVSGGNAVYAADMTADGSPDFIVSSSSGAATEWTNKADATAIFVQDTASTFPAYAHSAFPGAIGFFNSDTSIDLALPNGPVVGILLITNNGVGVFSVSVTNNGITANGSLATNDFNLDGLSDIVMDNSANGFVQVFTNSEPGARGFGTLSTNNVTTGGTTLPVTTADINADGWPDIVVPISSSGYMVLTNSRVRLFPQFESSMALQTSATQIIGDFNKDGRPDVVSFGTQAGNVVVVVSYNYPFLNGTSLGMSFQDLYNGTNLNLNVLYSSTAVTPANAWTPGFPNAGTLIISTNYLPFTANGLKFINGTVMTANTTSTVTFNTSGNSETIYNTSASTIGSLAITLSTSATPGAINRYATHGICTSVTVTGTVSIGSAVTALTADSTVAWQALTSSTWTRIQ